MIPCTLSTRLFDSTVSFRLRIGGGGSCDDAETGEDVVLEYRVSGSSTFTLLASHSATGQFLFISLRCL